jgi:hypothetical protein
MSRNMLFTLVGVLVIALAGLGFWIYQEQNNKLLEVDVGGNRITVQQR